MSGSLGTLDYPQVDSTQQPPNPLQDYHDQLGFLHGFIDRLPAPAITQPPQAPATNDQGPMQSVAQPPTLAEGWSSNANQLADYVAHQRAEAAAAGLWNPDTGLPTAKGIVEAGKQTAMGVLMGTTAPGEVPAPGLMRDLTITPKAGENPVTVPVRPASEDVHDTVASSFKYGQDVGPSTVPIDSLNGGVDLNQPKETARVDALAKQISGPDGYISRPIVDTDGNVIEGQHRVEALRQLGATEVPVHVVQDLAKGVDVPAMEAAVKQGQPGMHSDQVQQLTQYALEAHAEMGSSAGVRQAYDPPEGHEPAWEAALSHLENQPQNALAQRNVEVSDNRAIVGPGGLTEGGPDGGAQNALVGRAQASGDVGGGAGEQLGQGRAQAYQARSVAPSEALVNPTAVRAFAPTRSIDGASTPVYHELDAARGGAQAFHQAISAARDAHPDGASVALYAPDDYAGMRLFTTPERDAGFALKGDDIVSVFKHPDAPHSGTTLSMLDVATSQGGRRLDAFDGALPRLYGKSGFKAVGRLPWNDEYAPPGWNYEKNGRPDVVFMAHDPAHGAPYAKGDGEPVGDYDAGVRAQDAALSPRSNAPQPENALARANEPAPTPSPQFTPAKGDGHTTVQADVGKLDASLAKDPDMYVGPGGAGGIKGRYQRFQDYLKTGKPVEQPQVAMGPNGEASVVNGRHRMAVLRDQGMASMPVSVPNEDAAAFSAKFGSPDHALTSPTQGNIFSRLLRDNRGGGPNPLARETWTGTNTLSGARNEAPVSAEAPGEADRVSTRLPSAKTLDYDPHARNDLRVDLDAARSHPESYAKNVDLIREQPALNLSRVKHPDSISDRFVAHLKDNILAIYDRMSGMDPEVTRRAQGWYDGANRIAQRMADQYGYSHRQMAAVLAALSPQKDWFQNVNLAARLMDTVQRMGNRSATPEMKAWAKRWTENAEKDPDEPKASVEKFRGAMARNGDRPLSQITDNYDRAVWVRAYDEAHNTDRSYRIVSPEGDLGANAVTNKGANQRVTWGSFNEIAKGLNALKEDTTSNISQSVGGAHKVRNFYNNIISPNAPHGDITVDTHAIAGALLRPLGGSTRSVAQGLGTGGNVGAPASTGIRGLYAHYADAYRQAAAERGVLPRQMQSVTWEGTRGLFSPEQRRSGSFVKNIDNIWRDHAKGRIDANEARQRIFDAAGGINPPEWAGP
jgi:hypothetical protein